MMTESGSRQVRCHGGEQARRASETEVRDRGRAKSLTRTAPTSGALPQKEPVKQELRHRRMSLLRGQRVLYSKARLDR